MRDIAAQLLADSNVKVIQGKSDILRIVFRIEMYSNKSRAYFELIIIFAFRLIKEFIAVLGSITAIFLVPKNTTWIYKFLYFSLGFKVSIVP